MIVHGIEEVTLKDSPIHYRKVFSGLGDVELSQGDRQKIVIAFAIEIHPAGEPTVSVQLKEHIDYPLLPLIRALKEKVIAMKDADQLP